MTVNELTETLKAKGYKMASYTLWKSNIKLSEVTYDVTYTSYLKDGKLAIETKGVKGAGEAKIVFIGKHFKEEFKEMGIEVGTVLK